MMVRAALFALTIFTTPALAQPPVTHRAVRHDCLVGNQVAMVSPGRGLPPRLRVTWPNPDCEQAVKAPSQQNSK